MGPDDFRRDRADPFGEGAVDGRTYLVLAAVVDRELDEDPVVALCRLDGLEETVPGICRQDTDVSKRQQPDSGFSPMIFSLKSPMR